MMNRLLFLNTIWLSLFSITSFHAYADNWPRFRGPNGTGISNAKTVPTSWTADDFNWTTNLPGTGHSSPVVIGNRVFVQCCNQANADRFVACVNAANGEILWSKEFKSDRYHLHRDNNYASSTPAADKNGVVVCWASPEKFTLTALDNRGTRVWQRDFGKYKSVWGGAASPVIIDDIVVILKDQMDPRIMAPFLPKGTEITDPGKSHAIAVDRLTGEVRWTIPRKTVIAGYATPCVRKLKSGKQEIVFFGTGNGMMGVDPRSGKINWELPNALPSRTVMSPVIADELIIGSHGIGLVGDRLVAVRPAGKNKKPEIAFRLRKSIPLVPTALCKDGLLFLACDNGVISCIRSKDGEELWRQRHRGKFYSSPICVDDNIYCADRKGKVLVFKAGEKFEKLAVSSLGEACFATPAVANGAIYFRTATKLISIGGN